MNIKTGTEKKSWSTPQVEELGVDKTLGGTTKAFFETSRNASDIFQDNFGTVPGKSK